MEPTEEEPVSPRIEEAPSLLPDLTLLGIDEADKGICLDTFENRKTLRAHQHTWIPVFDTEGEPTQFIQAISPEMMQAKALVSLSDKKSLLEDPRDRNSDYVTGLDLILESDADSMVPAWALAATRQWLRVEEKREETGKHVRPALAGPPSRCSYIKADGVRCQYWTGGRVTENGLCRVHLGKHLNGEANLLDHARNRLRSNALAASEQLEKLMDTATSEGTRLKAATEILDRVGIRGGVEVDSTVHMEVRPAADIVAERMERLRKNQLRLEQAKADAEALAAEEENTVYVEVVEDSDDER